MGRRPTAASSGNQTLSKAKSAKQDEFYTQLSDIENELKHYREQLRGKIILCNCDDPYESNFFRHFALNFNALGLKKLIATSYAKSAIVGAQLPLGDIEGLKPEGRAPYAIEINEVLDHNGDGATDLADVEYLLRNNANTCQTLKGDPEFGAGDFRSAECIAYLKEADVVVTNPPFSLFREFVDQVVQYERDFIVIGNTNSITYKEVFSLIINNRLQTGNTNFNVGMFFEVPRDWDHYHHVDQISGKKIARVSTSCWFTSMKVAKHQAFIPLFRRYNPDDYPTYDNFDAIEVSKVSDIPVDYKGLMGVPITFLDKFNREQFEIVGYEKSYDLQTKRYANQIQVDVNGFKSNVSKLNDGAAILVDSIPVGKTYYIVDDKYYVQAYKRIFIRYKELL